jgi:hypothetical protein
MGYVRDGGGLPLPGVSVVVSDRSAGSIARAVSDAQGRYEVTGLPSGTFSVRAELTGFTPSQIPGVTFGVGRTEERDFILSVGSLQETVTVTGESAVRSVPRPSVGYGGGTGGGAFRPGAAAMPPPPPPPAVVEERMLAQSIAASGADLGDLFEYKLSDRVTIRRNQSALVPILQTAVAADRLSLWNDQMGPRPRRAVWLRNSSPLTLDAGSLSIVDGGAFAGEGLIEALKPNERRLVTYAADLGVQVNARADNAPTRVVRLRAAKGMVAQESEQRWRRTYTVRNDDRDPRTVVIEHPIRADWNLAGSAKPDESTAAVHRFRVSVPPGQTTVLDVDEIKPGATTFQVTELHRERLELLVTSSDSRQTVERAMAPIFAKSAELDEVEQGLERIYGDLQQITEDQARVRENIKALGDSSAHRRLLERYTRQLEEQEDRVDALKREQSEQQARQARAERELNDLIAAMTFDVTP